MIEFRKDFKPRFSKTEIAAFTLLELMTVIVIISILSIMVFGISTDLRRRADRAGCVANLKNLYVATANYVQQQGHWPQVDYKLLQHQEKDYAKGWIKALNNYGAAHVNWLCPSIQKQLDNPDVSRPENMRIDYIASPFDDRLIAPYEFPKQPWFAERGNPHGGGNLLILTNGQILSLTEAVKGYR